MKKYLIAGALGITLALGIGGAAAITGSGDQVSCGSVTASTPDHIVGVDGAPVKTIPGDVQTATVCVTATAQTVTETVPVTSSTSTTVSTTVPTTSTVTTAPSGNLFWSANFETGNMSEVELHTGLPTWGNSSAKAVQQGAIINGLNGEGQIGSAPAANSGNYSAALVVSGNATGSAGGQRAELTSSNFATVGTERWYGLSVYIPSSPNRDASGNFKGYNNALWQTGWGTALSLKMNDQGTNNFEIADSAATSAMKNGWSGAYYTISPLLYDQWIHFDIHVFWSTGSSGYFEVYENGVLQTLKGLSVKTFSGTRVNGPNFGVAKQMDSEFDFYRSCSCTFPNLIYLDNFKIGDTQAIVQP